MTDSRLDRVKRFAEIHVKARDKAGKSQEFMALELGVAKKTVQNWEKGISSPSFFQSLEWFRVLNINPMPYYLSILYPDKYSTIKNASTDEEVNAAFSVLVEQLSINDKKAFLYFYYGEHGSPANTLIQLLLAHAHTPLQTRITQAILTYNLYEMEKERDNLICTDAILPDLDTLSKSIMRARLSAIQHEYGYTLINEDDIDDIIESKNKGDAE